MTEIEKVKSELKVLEAKLAFLEELEKTKSPVEEAFKDWMGVYPPTNPSVDNIFDIRWRAFQMGYNAAYEEKVVEEEPQKPKTLWERFYDAKWSDSACDEFCEIVEQWLYDNSTTVEEDHYTVTLKLKKGMLREIK